MIFPEKEITTGTETYGWEQRREQFKREDFSGGAVVKTLHFQCKGQGFNSWSGD